MTDSESHSRFYPLNFNAITNEPYLRLPSPHDNIIITPQRLSDAEEIVPILNDEKVYMTLLGPPFPYTIGDAHPWLLKGKQESDALLAELAENHSTHAVGGCPVNILREVQEDGSDVYLGSVDLHRCRWFHVPHSDEKLAMIKANEARTAGDPAITWEFGDYLASSHHGRGIMSAAIGVVLRQWAIPRMRVRHMSVTAFQSNPASVRVFEKNGFILKGIVEDCVDMQESKGGGKTGLHVLEWSMAEM
ncbi:hypothetical protein BD410DRAFT_790348 [Rickenella mellea]|uniref:N-acetyltransferase domain-containing protein n=1 Tax=Rickenella mellea TaxID=50990 RepID=A0A4Y7Q011_9AGAM|nr:hypothetical protein BD410DRAFT_790348 [Rickenella mellea]